jgi:hypothetical protein
MLTALATKVLKRRAPWSNELSVSWPDSTVKRRASLKTNNCTTLQSSRYPLPMNHTVKLAESTGMSWYQPLSLHKFWRVVQRVLLFGRSTWVTIWDLQHQLKLQLTIILYRVDLHQLELRISWWSNHLSKPVRSCFHTLQVITNEIFGEHVSPISRNTTWLRTPPQS